MSYNSLSCKSSEPPGKEVAVGGENDSRAPKETDELIEFTVEEYDDNSQEPPRFTKVTMSRKEYDRRIGFTEEQLDKEAEEYENDTWDASKFGKVVMGRPSLADEEVKPITFRLPVSKIAALDRRAAREGRTRSEELRLAVDDRLMKA